MSLQRLLMRSFSNGEISPELFGRADLARVQSSLATCRNFIAQPQGPARNRTGLQFVKEVGGASANRVKLIPFSYTNIQTFAIELGAGFFRFHTLASTLLAGSPAAYNNATAYTLGALVSSGGVNYYCVQATTGHAPPNATYWYAMPVDGTYEIPNPYAAADLFDIHYVQSADVMTLVHPNYQPMELRRLGATNWQLTQCQFVPTISPPAVGGSVGTPITHSYVVTAVSIYSFGRPSESVPSSVVTCSNDLTQFGASNLIKWTGYSGAYGYRVYKLTGGVYGYLGTASSTSFVDDGSASANAASQPIGTATPAVSGVSATATAASGVTVSAVATTGTGSTTYTYVVTSVDANNRESVASTSASCTNDLTVSGNKNTVGWPSVAGAVRYNVYKYSNGLYGYIGQAAGTSFIDNYITADISQTPPTIDASLTGAGNYPQAVAYFEQRRAFAGWTNGPQNLIATRSGTESDMSYHIPSRADDRLALRIAAREASAIRHIVPLQDIILLTASNEFRMYASDGNAISAANVTIKPQAYVGANNVQPQIIGNSILYCASRGGHIREMSYNWQAQSYLTGDVTLLATHLFDYHDVLDMAFANAPYPILWAVNDAGELLGLSYVPEQQISAWHRHDTENGLFESCCVITENDEDYLYVVVNRTINGSQKRYVERLTSRNFATQADAFFVDCGATYSGAATKTITGLTWLEGQTVNVLGDGAVMPRCTVTGGTITLPHAVSKAQIGLRITSDLKTIPFMYQGTNDLGQGRVKNINKVYLRVYNSSGVFAGPDADHLVQYAQRSTEPYGTPPALVSNEIEIVLAPTWSQSGQLFVRQTDPLPLTVVSMTLEVSVGG